MKPIHNRRGLLPEWVKDTNYRAEFSVNSQIQMRILLRYRIQPAPLHIIHRAMLILKYKMIAADDSFLSLYLTGNAMGYYILDLGMHLLMRNATPFRFFHHSIGNRMRIMLLKAGRDLQRIPLRHATEGIDANHPRLRMCQSARLVENNRICLRSSFQEFPALDRNIIF